jgi:hypothetical protein
MRREKTQMSSSMIIRLQIVFENWTKKVGKSVDIPKRNSADPSSGTGA